MLNATKKEKFILLVISFYFLFSIKHIIYGGIFYDDWALTVGHLYDQSFSEKFDDLVFKTFLTRPIGGIYLAFLTELKKLDHLYIIINSTFWLLSALLIYNSFAAQISKQGRNYILLSLLFPSFASTMIFSPVTQTLGVMSIFFWSISIFYARNKNFFKSIIFFIVSVLTYEVSIILLFFNIYLLSVENEKSKTIKKLLKLIFFFGVITISIIIFQILLSKIIGYNASLKYAFWFEGNQIFFEEDFLQNIKKYFFKPLILIIYDIPKLLLSSIVFFKFEIFYLFTLILFACLILINFNSFEINNFRKTHSKYILFLAIVISSISVFFVYLLVTSVPQVNGYYNRGLVGLFVCFSLFLGFLNDIDLKSKITNNFKHFFIIILIILNFNSFSIQQGNHIKAEIERQKLLNEITNFYESKKNKTSEVLKPVIFMIFDTYLNQNYNDETIFSEEVEDLYFAVNYHTNKNVIAKRIYKDKYCYNILSINDNRIIGRVTSKDRKFKEKEIAIFYEYSKMNKDLYFYSNSKFIKLSYDNKKNYEIFKNILKCQI